MTFSSEWNGSDHHMVDSDHTLDSVSYDCRPYPSNYSKSVSDSNLSFKLVSIPAPKIENDMFDLFDFESMSCEYSVDPSCLVSEYAHIEPDTVLKTSFRSTLDLSKLCEVMNNFISNQPNVSYQYFASESVWEISYTSKNVSCTMLINIYRGRSGYDHVIEGQKCDGDSFLANSVYYGIRNVIEQVEFPEREQAQLSTQVDYMRLISV